MLFEFGKLQMKKKKMLTFRCFRSKYFIDQNTRIRTVSRLIDFVLLFTCFPIDINKIELKVQVKFLN